MQTLLQDLRYRTAIRIGLNQKIPRAELLTAKQN
jgi:hypothetical protein